MTSRELIAAEANNVDRIALYREGLFWKAYERSAYALCTQVRPFKPTRKVLKTLAGGDIVSVGFPSVAADRILAGLVRLDASDSADGSVASAAGAVAGSAVRMLFATRCPLVESDFRAWKSALPISITIPRPSVDETSADRADTSGSAVSTAEPSSPARPLREVQPLCDHSLHEVAASRPHWWTRVGNWFVRSATLRDSSAGAAASAEQCLDALRKFEVADKTPMECMMFIAELRKRFLKI